MANALHVPPSPWQHALPLLRAAVGALDEAQRHVPALAGALLGVGERYWDFVVRTGLADAAADFALLPSALTGAPRAPRTAAVQAV